MKREILYEVDGVALDFSVGEQHVTAVQKGSIFIPKGEITIIFGPSGSGKSSLLNILSGLQKPTSGNLRYKSENIYVSNQDSLAHYRAHELGIIYQTNYWVKSLDVLDNVALPLYFLGYSRAGAHDKARRALERVNMQSYTHKYPYLLSGGEQQRIAFARAIVNDAPVIIADEPTGNLDSKNGDRVIELFTEFQQNEGKTIILVTHNLEYLPIAQHLVQIQDGKMTQIEHKDITPTVKQLLSDVQNRISTLAAKGAKK
ncbi:ABC transporter ATP-binding protein [Candidatus Saccharibacteria bacterium]|nr:ABC transporter ATP-binding protein [Candidatus Saccharibacteria bacterium]